MPHSADDGEDRIDPEVARFVAAILAASAADPDLATRSFRDQRAAAAQARTDWRQGGPDMHHIRDLRAATPRGEVRVRLFVPSPADDQPCAALVYLHGGGFTFFSVDTHDRLMREYAAGAGVVVIGVDYSLSPEARFPIALHESAGVVEWLQAEAGRLGIDAARIAIGGDSAGANLALATCLLRRDRGQAPLAAMLLNYGFFDADFTTPSQLRHGDPGGMLTRAELAGYLDNYLGDAPRTDPLALPALAMLHDLPPSLHVIAVCDPLADGDRAMARRLAAAGNDATARVYDGAAHSFLEAVAVSSLAQRAFAESATWLAQTLSGPASRDAAACP